MSVVFALEKLFDDVVARFAAESTVVDNQFGWREPHKQKTEASRVTWVPGRPDGEAGEFRAPRFPGANPRSLATFGELFTVYVAGVDTTNKESERAQYAATRFLADAWYRAIHLAAHSNVRVISAAWNVSKNERRRGAELIFICEIDAPIPDTPHDIAPVDATAAIDTSLEDVTETTVASPTP